MQDDKDSQSEKDLAKISVVERIRAAHKMSQRDMADYVGCSVGAVPRWIATNSLPKNVTYMAKLRALATAAGIDLGSTHEAPKSDSSETPQRRYRNRNDSGHGIRFVADSETSPQVTQAHEIFSGLESGDRTLRRKAALDLMKAPDDVKLVLEMLLRS